MSFRNRCLIAGGNGIQALTVPIEGGREQRAIYRDVRIDEREDWRKRHWRTLFSAYGKAPFFEHYGGGLEALFQERKTFLVDWNLTVLDWLSARLKVQLPELAVHEEGISTGPFDLDLADLIRPAHYTGTIGGLTPPTYTQVFQDRHGFLPNLSILDMLLCLGPEAGRRIQDERAV